MPPRSTHPLLAVVTGLALLLAACATPPAPPPPPGPVSRDVGLACPVQVRPEMPRKALQDGISGLIRAQARIVGGKVVDVKILTGPRVYHQAVITAMKQYQCVSDAAEVLVTQEFDFKVE